MEFRDWLLLASFLGSIMVTIIGIAIAFTKQGNNVDLVKQDLANHKENHKNLERRVTEHESKIDDKLETLSDKMDSLKDLIIERTENR